MATLGGPDETLAATVAAAETPAAPPDHGFIERLPRSWCGVFRWRGDDQDQHYTSALKATRSLRAIVGPTHFSVRNRASDSTSGISGMGPLWTLPLTPTCQN